MTFTLPLDGSSLTLANVRRTLRESTLLTLTAGARRRMARSRAVVERAVTQGDTIYGVTTGFGRLASVAIDRGDLAQLQVNLVRSHAAGVGEPLAPPIAQLLLLFRINALAKGYSGVRPTLVDTLIRLYNRRIWPVVPEQGSVGASGDLAPLAHLALILIGEGEAWVRGRRTSGRAALKAARVPPLTLAAKEGLALINGTQAMLAVGVHVLLEFQELLTLADLAGAMSLEALNGLDEPFDARLHRVRPHPGQQVVAANLRTLLRGRRRRPDAARVQDAYSLRCMPQIHGALRDATAFARGVFEREMNAATDNPLVFEGGRGVILSGGNFHGQPIALALDVLGMAMAELALVSERRTERLVNPDLSGLPPFLTSKSGLQSGLMMAQVTAAALASENKVYAHPASVDSIPTSGGQEDVVSMGMAAARKARLIIVNTRRVLACEFVCAAEGLRSTPGRWGAGVERAAAILHRRIPPFIQDRAIAPALAAAESLITSGALLQAAGPLR